MMAITAGLLDGIRALDLVAPDALEVALDIQRQTGERLGTILIRQGFVFPDEITLALSYQAGFDIVFSIDDHPYTLDLLALSRIPKELAYRLGVFPIRLDGNHLRVAMCDPLDAIAVQTLEGVAQIPVDVVATPLSEIKRVLLSVFQDEDSQIGVIRGVEGWGLEEEERAVLLSDPHGHRLLRWLVERGRRAGARALGFIPTRETGFGGHVRFENAASNTWLGDVFRLSPEWYQQLVRILHAARHNEPWSFQCLDTDVGLMGRMPLDAKRWKEVKLDAEGLLALTEEPPPGLLLLCDPLEWRRGLVASNLADSLAGTRYEVISIEGIVAPKGALFIPKPKPGAPIIQLGAFKPKVTLLGSGFEEVVAETLESGHPEGWLILPMPVATVAEAVLHLRERGPTLGSLSAALSAIVEVGDDNRLQVFRPDEAFVSALRAWDINRIETWSKERRSEMNGEPPSEELAI